MGLEAHFQPTAWSGFMGWITKEYRALPEDLKNQLFELGLPEDIRVAALVVLRGQAREWLHREIPALGQSRPIDLLADSVRSNAVRELLMRLPE